MTSENYPATLRVLTPREIVARWRDLGWGDAAASEHVLKNEYGVPLHACHGVRQDAHYWSWVASWCRDGSGVRPGTGCTKSNHSR